MKLTDTFSLSFRTIRSNFLRTSITVAIIALGIAALIGINTAIQAIAQKFQESFSSMGANGFTIRYRQVNVQFGRPSVKMQSRKSRKLKTSNANKTINILEAEAFKEMYKYPSEVSISIGGGGNNIVNYGSLKTNPTVRINGGDENYVDMNGYDLAAGRNINTLDVTSARNVCIIGKDILDKLFKGNNDLAVDKVISINGISYRVIGTLQSKGSTFGMSLDNLIITSYKNVRRFFNTGTNASFSIGVKVNDVSSMDVAIGEADGTFRAIRKVSVQDDDNFLIDKSDSFVEMLMKQLGWLTGAAVVIGFITLIGAAIGLMNIMLVAVTERTKEVGLIKAIGGKQRNVRQQFLFESIIISLLGAFFGIIIGVLLGNIVSVLMGTGFVIPWVWVALGVLICSVVGLLAGLYPAFKASRLNPIEALRYE
ncbi:ABC transporter permease [Pinibacter soli]|uniref:ABC transporter permease n=1 Tax=Pinibacter soli TaxID=3044211 RepID=A0ABT6R6H7_9BACT|nr:ABC transporter permease [Pinibacter soli]MDI3318168.1 ABC transporter permease [Pinibacter soli]